MNSSEGAEARELKQGSQSRGEQAGKKEGRQAGRLASTRRAFSWNHALEGLVEAVGGLGSTSAHQIK